MVRPSFGVGFVGIFADSKDQVIFETGFWSMTKNKLYYAQLNTDFLTFDFFLLPDLAC